MDTLVFSLILEKYEQTAFCDIELEPLSGHQKQKRHVLNFRLNRKAVIAQDKICHYYLLQTDLDAEQITDNQVAESYKSLMMVEKSFRDIKTQIEVRPIRHWKKRRIQAHIYLCYLSLWLSKYIENKWKERNITTQVGPTLVEWDHQLLMCEKVDPHGNMVEVSWNKGKNAITAIQQIQSYGEASAINAHS